MDLVLAGIPYEEAAIHRAVPVEVAGRPVRFCTAEDLILHKLASSRARDRDDARGVIVTQGPALDRTYLDPRVRQLAGGLEQPEVAEFYRDCLRAANLPGPD